MRFQTLFSVLRGSSITSTKGTDLLPVLLVLGLAGSSLPLIGVPSTWLTLTMNGLAMGFIIFLMASGLTLTFGLMDVFNFGHGLFIAYGAYMAYAVLGIFKDWAAADNLFLNFAVTALCMFSAMILTAGAGWIFERLLIRPTYGRPLTQVLVTVGGMVVGEELLKIVCGAELKAFSIPFGVRGSVQWGDAFIEKYRIVAVAVGIAIYFCISRVLNNTKVGLLVRAGVANREMVESFGHKVKSLFVCIFVAGSALAGLGGVMWGMYQQIIFPQMGTLMTTQIFMVIIIGGLGSIKGTLVAAILVGLMTNYAGFLSTKLALASNILLMTAILAWRPQGLYGQENA